MRKAVLAAAVACSLPLLSARAYDGTQWGRDLDTRNTSQVGLTLGDIVSVDGTIKETTRPYFSATGQEQKQRYALTYTLDDLGFDGNYLTYGATGEKMWKYITLQGNLMYANPSASSTADRDYFISVGEVDFNGKSYDHMKIKEGQSFDADVDAFMLNGRVVFTPVTVERTPLAVEFMPEVYLGLTSIFGYYEIDAGRATGTTFYELPAHEYVVGGTGSGWAGMVLPEIGLGGEINIWQGERFGRDVNLVFQAFYSLFQFSGTTSDLAVSSDDRNKLLDVDYDAYEARLLFELPMSQSVDLFLGAGWKYTKANASVEADEKNKEDIIAARDKFNKDIDFEMSQVFAIAGIRY